MNKTKIEWVRNPDGTQGYTWNPITGCLNHIDGRCKGGNFPCYAYKLAHGRLRDRYLGLHGEKYAMCDHEHDKRLNDPFYPRLWPDKLDEDLRWCRGIFVCDMSDLFGIGVPEEWTNKVLDRIRRSSHRSHYYLLTKQPQNLPKFSPFPGNCWVGVTATDSSAFKKACEVLHPVEARVRFISIEPLLNWHWENDIRETPLSPPGTLMDYMDDTLDWLIIGACTGTKPEMSELVQRYPELTVMPYGSRYTAQPKIEWVSEIVKAADAAGSLVILKDNLRPLLEPTLPYGMQLARRLTGLDIPKMRQEFPKLK